MTQLEQISKEKLRLKAMISDSIERMDFIISGAKMKIDIDLHYHTSAVGVTKLIKTDIDIKLEI